MTSSDAFFLDPPAGPGVQARRRFGAAHAAPASAALAGAPPRLTMSAWERWEMTALEPRGDAVAPHAPQAPTSPASPALLHAAELARLRREARAAGDAEGRAEGHAQGLAAGRAEGYAQGHAQGLAAGLAGASAQAEQLRALAASLPAALRQADDALADTLLALALDIARQVVHRTLAAEPGWMLPLVRELLQAEPALQGAPRLLLHPQDAALVRQGLGGELEAAGWQVRADEQITPGGCRVLTASAELDATVESRWARAAAALRRDAAAAAG